MIAIIIKYWAVFLPAFCKTIILLISSAIISLAIGISIGFLRSHNSNQYFRIVFDSITFIFRGIPIYVQLLILYFVIPEIVGFSLSPMLTAIICMGLCSGAYISQIMRGTINSISPGQWLAAYSLGYSKKRAFLHIILPQAIKRAMSAILGELDQLVKTTSIVSTIGVLEITRAATNIVSIEMNPIPTYLAAAILYLVISATLLYITIRIERIQNACM